MSKFHIGKNGEAMPCTAKGNCPLGGEHFDTMEAASAYAVKVNIEAHGLIPSIKGRNAPAMYESSLEVNDPNGLLNDDYSVDIEPGVYYQVWDDLSIYNEEYFDDLDSEDEDPLSKQFSEKYRNGAKLLEGQNQDFDVIEVNGEKAYAINQYDGGSEHLPVLLIPKNTYDKMVAEGGLNDSYGPDAIEITKPTQIALDPDWDHEIWESDEMTDYNEGYGPRTPSYHFKDSDSYELKNGDSLVQMRMKREDNEMIKSLNNQDNRVDHTKETYIGPATHVMNRMDEYMTSDNKLTSAKEMSYEELVQASSELDEEKLRREAQGLDSVDRGNERWATTFANELAWRDELNKK